MLTEFLLELQSILKLVATRSFWYRTNIFCFRSFGRFTTYSTSPFMIFRKLNVNNLCRFKLSPFLLDLRFKKWCFLKLKHFFINLGKFSVTLWNLWRRKRDRLSQYSVRSCALIIKIYHMLIWVIKVFILWFDQIHTWGKFNSRLPRFWFLWKFDFNFFLFYLWRLNYLFSLNLQKRTIFKVVFFIHISYL